MTIKTAPNSLLQKPKRTLLYRSSWRYFLKHPVHLLFSVLGVALGVALVVGIDIASQSARQGFYLSSQSITGQASHRIINSGHMLPEAIYAQLRNELGLRKVAPLIKQAVWITAQNTRSSNNKQKMNTRISAQLVGIDPFSEAEIRTWQQGMIDSLPGDSLQRLLSETNTVLVASDFLNKYHLGVGDTLSLTVNEQQQQLIIIGIFNAPEVYQTQLNNWLISDISTVQELLAVPGAITQIDLLLDAGSSRKIAQIKQLLPEGVQLVKVSEHAEAISQLSQSFELNLSALSLLGLLVAMFLIYNTMMFSVVQRRDLLARLRVVGVSRKELFRLVLSEAFIIAVAATAAGLLIGIALAQILLYFVTRTINDLYYVLQVTQLHWNYFILFKALALGIGATLLSALIPAIEAAYTRPAMALQRSELENKIRRLSRWLVLPGLLAFLLVYLLLQVKVSEQSNGMLIAVFSVFILIAGFICLLPLFSRYLLALLAILMKYFFKLPGKIAVNNIVRSYSRSIVAIAALSISVSSALGIGIMVDSFRYTVDDWLLGYLKADYYISQMNNNASSEIITLIDPVEKQLISRLSQLSGVEYISSNQEVRFFIDGQYHQLTVLDIPEKSFNAFNFKQGDARIAQKSWFNEDAVIVSEPYAYKHGLTVGDSIYLPRAKKDNNAFRQPFTITGIYYHYGSEQGVINMSRATYKRHWQHNKYNALGLYVSDDVLLEEHKRDEFEQQVQEIISSQALQFISRQKLHSNSLVIFDRTFKITNVLKLLVVFVSFVGILTALMAIELERGREYAILRVTGLTGKQLAALVYIETITMGIVAAILAMPMGIALAYLLIEVINYRSFGWSMQFILPWSEFVIAAGLAILSAFLAAIYPARHLAELRPAFAMRGE